MRKKLNKILKKYIKKFEKKHGLTFEFAVSDDLMDVICFGDVLFFSINDIVYDIDTKQPNGLIIDWLYDSINQDKYINFYSYSKGLRYEQIKNR